MPRLRFEADGYFCDCHSPWIAVSVGEAYPRDLLRASLPLFPDGAVPPWIRGRSLSFNDLPECSFVAEQLDADRRLAASLRPVPCYPAILTDQ
jgi:hypothetical protein